jgi:nucleotide-binding universal stress UspA family protein
LEAIMYIPGHVAVIVVGIDGSDRSQPVLRWAVQQARAVHGKLQVVLAWQLPELADHVPMRIEATLDEEEEKRVDSLISATLNDLGIRENELQIETFVQEGGPVRLLLRHAKDADLLVLGSKGHGRDANKLLGSVTSSCLVQASCPVVIVPVAERSAE